MLKKENRIHLKKEFEEVKLTGRMISTPLFGLVWKQSDDKEKKIGFVVSKRVAKKAVFRNRIKRLLAESSRKNWELLPLGFRGIFLAKSTLLGLKLAQVEKTVVESFKKAG